MSREPALSSIPEAKESQEIIKWVPKKKHEVLKAKYKCLKKLFQIYDASVIGILPETIPIEPIDAEEERMHRKRRSRRMKTDACAGTTEVSSGDVTIQSDLENSIPTVIKELSSQVSQIIVTSKTSIIKRDEYTQDSKENISVQSEKYSECSENRYYIVNERRKPTRFQLFLQRIFGVRHASYYNTRTYAASDNNIFNRYEKRRRRGLRIRRVQTKKIHSEMAIRDLKSPVILSYVQSVQRIFLTDTTPRQCPITGCGTMLYGIINYNDHLNLCHFPERRCICHYCHEGFVNDEEKFAHENEHLGISKLNNHNTVTTSSESPSMKIASVTQTDPELCKPDVPEDKLKKIVSFFDKIANPEQIICEIKKKRFSESNLKTQSRSSDYGNRCNSDSLKMSSCVQLQGRKSKVSSGESDVTSFLYESPMRCQLCGEKFQHSRQLSLHVDLQHRAHERFSKFHSCAGIINTTRTADKQLPSTEKSSETDLNISCDPSTNIVYYTSVESIDQPSVDSSGMCYKWEPGTKIIRV